MLRFWNLIDSIQLLVGEFLCSSSDGSTQTTVGWWAPDDHGFGAPVLTCGHTNVQGCSGPSYPDVPQCCHPSATSRLSFLWPFWVQIWARTLAWKMPWTEEPGRLQSMGSLRVWHDWVTSLSCTGEGNGNPLQCSCLENPRDRGAWWAAVYGVAQSRTRLKWLSTSQEESWSIWGKRSAVRRERNDGCRMGAELWTHKSTFNKAVGLP